LLRSLPNDPGCLERRTGPQRDEATQLALLVRRNMVSPVGPIGRAENGERSGLGVRVDRTADMVSKAC
jgi:hypothetical protein